MAARGSVAKVEVTNGNIEASANYMIEAWIYNSSNNKLISTAVKYV